MFTHASAATVAASSTAALPVSVRMYAHGDAVLARSRSVRARQGSREAPEHPASTLSVLTAHTLARADRPRGPPAPGAPEPGRHIAPRAEPPPCA